MSDERERDDRRFAEARIALPYGWRRTPLPPTEDEDDYRADHAPESWESDDE